MCVCNQAVRRVTASIRQLGARLCVGMASALFVVASTQAEPPRASGDKSTAPTAGAQTGFPATSAGERALIDRIEELTVRGTAEFPSDADTELRTAEQVELVGAVDELLKKYPDTGSREFALMVKLSALAALARTQPTYLDALLKFTEEISSKNPKGELASENAYCAIQAFVLGARREQMPEEKRLAGTVERYRAFLHDFPKSSRRAVIWASLVRNMIAQKQVDQAREEVTKMELEFPATAAVKRSKGEINRARALGLPFALSIKTPSGDKVRTKNFLGEVVVVHFWASWNRASMEQLTRLASLNEKYKDKGLRLVGVSLDKDREKFGHAVNEKKVTWPQMYDEKGHESEIVMASGVVELPLVFVVDRLGVARTVGRGDDLEELIPKLLAEPAPVGPSPGSKP